LLITVGATAGAAAGALLLRSLSRAGVLDGAYRQWRETTEAVREGMAEREAELRQALGLDTAMSDRGLPPDEVRHLVEDPTGARARGPREVSERSEELRGLG
jgi:hypothetical protein